jgi:hypothetical protein
MTIIEMPAAALVVAVAANKMKETDMTIIEWVSVALATIAFVLAIIGTIRD